MNRTRYQKTAMTLGAVTLFAMASACSQAGLRQHYQQMRPNMIKGEWQVAEAQMEKVKEELYGENDRVMFWLNLGSIQHYAGSFDKSNQNLVNAEKAMQELWTTSVSAEAGKVALGETFHSYGGEDFEKVLVYLFTSLNNVKLGKVGDALVEARRADELLKKMQVYYDKEEDQATVYKQDAFMLWLVGLYYEIEGQSINDAYLAYKAAYQAYKSEYMGTYGTPIPAYVAEDMIRTAQLSGLADEAERWKQETGGGGATIENIANGMGELVLLHSNGESPFKRELKFSAPMPDGYVMSMALPEFVAIPSKIAYAEVRVGEQVVRTELAEPIDNICLENFKVKLPGLKARAIARAIIKYAATKAAQAAGGGSNSALGTVLGLAANVAAVATEAADLRSWTLLPANIGVARLWLPEGAHQASVTYHNSTGAQVGRTDTMNVEIRAGGHTIQSVRTIQ